MTAAPRTLRSPDDLIAAGLASECARAELQAIAGRYAIAIPPAMAALIDTADVADPIARQFVPDGRELDQHPREIADPIGDGIKSPTAGVVHRYPDRVLLKAVNVCPVYCRFCFRREMVGPGNAETLSEAELAAAIAYIAGDRSIWEVIITGGDPLILSARRLAELTGRLAAIPHVKILRWHTRVPVVDPGRVTPELVAALTSAGESATVYVGLHVNHARELTREACAAICALTSAGVMLVSQTVLLRGVNDNVGALEELFRALVTHKVKPYYLHHGDLAPGTAHFRVPITKGRALMSVLRQRLSGLALPSYMLDLPGAHGKVPLEAHAIQQGEREWTIHDASGLPHSYQDACESGADD